MSVGRGLVEPRMKKKGDHSHGLIDFLHNGHSKKKKDIENRKCTACHYDK